MASIGKLLFSGVLFVLMALSAYHRLTNKEPNKCEMTYMYEHPEYIPITMPSSVKTKYPHYGLYVYGEGMYAEALKQGRFSGIPVLFIPGNGGSHKQVRSLASVAMRKAADDDDYDFHFNFFTVAINEDLGAFYGPSLEQQTEFVIASIQRILNIYSTSRVRNKPKSIVLVGHSMGGLVARAVFLNKNITSAIVPLIITQASPHTRPPIVMDSSISLFYDKVNDYWTMEREFDLKDPVLVSVGAGDNDFQVSMAHTHTELADVSSSTNNVPRCWLTTDHQAIVWCKQLVMPTVRALFESIDRESGHITTDKDRIVKVFNYHLISRSAGKHYGLRPHSTSIALDHEGKWSEIVKRQHTFKQEGVDQITYLMLGLHPGYPQYHKATIIASGLESRDWIFACNADLIHNGVRMCKNAGPNLSDQGRLLPGDFKKFIQLELTPLADAGFSHVIIIIPSTKKAIDISIDIHSVNDRLKSIELQPLIVSLAGEVINDNTPPKALAYNLSLTGLDQPWQSYHISLNPSGRTCPPEQTLIGKLVLPWTDHSFQKVVTSTPYQFNIGIDIPSSTAINGSVPYIQFLLHPDCTYSISVKGNMAGVFSKLVWLYGTQLPAYVACHLLLTLSKQFKAIDTDGSCPSFFTSLMSLTPLMVVPFIKISSLVLKQLLINDDFQHMSDSGLNFGLLPIFLFLACVPVTLIIGAFAYGSIVIVGNAVHSFFVKILRRSLGGSDIVAELAVTGLARIPVLVAVGLISLAYSTCGTLAMCIATLFYFIRIFQKYEDYIQELVIGLLPGSIVGTRQPGKVLSRIHFHLTLLLLLFISTVLQIAPLIAWAKLAQTNLQLKDDPSLACCIVSLISLCFLWQKKLPDPSRKYYKEMSYFLHGAATFVILFGCVHLYIVSWFIAFVLLVVALHQALAPKNPYSELESPPAASVVDRPPYMRQVSSESISNSVVSDDATNGTLSMMDSECLDESQDTD
ncbi:unnamed protein product, partial [Meganyctiphanes norvegica]